MKTTTQFTLILVAVALLAACTPNMPLNTSDAQVLRTASSIADFTPPAGYTPEFSASLMGYTAASFTPGNDLSHLYLVSSADEADAEKLLGMLEDVAPGDRDMKARMTVVETRPVSVRGQKTTLVISEGVNGSGTAYKQAMVSFEGKNGPALLVYSEPAGSWNMDTVEQLIGSIR
jgi:hypothetical protein